MSLWRTSTNRSSVRWTRAANRSIHGRCLKRSTNSSIPIMIRSRVRLTWSSINIIVTKGFWLSRSCTMITRIQLRLRRINSSKWPLLHKRCLEELLMILYQWANQSFRSAKLLRVALRAASSIREISTWTAPSTHMRSMTLRLRLVPFWVSRLFSDTGLEILIRV